MKIEFSGHSDDIVMFKAGKVSDEIGAYHSDDGLHARTLRVATIGGSQGVDVHAVYDGTWSFAVGLIEEGRSLPKWTYSIEVEHAYSTRLIIDTGEDMVTVEDRGDGK